MKIHLAGWLLAVALGVSGLQAQTNENPRFQAPDPSADLSPTLPENLPPPPTTPQAVAETPTFETYAPQYFSPEDPYEEGAWVDYEPLRLFKQREGKLNVFGWVDGGFIGNTGSPKSRFNGPYNAVDRANEVMGNQLYLVAEKKLSEDRWGVGMRLDTLYGEDWLLASSVGFERNTAGGLKWNPEYYGIAFPQGYIDVGRSDLSLKIGHFYSIVGYEGVMAPNNFFYSKAYSYQFSQPITHWGGLATWNVNSNWKVQAGLTNGWDTLDRNLGDRLNTLAGVKYSADAGWWSSFAIVSGDDINNPGGQAIPNQLANRTRYSLLAGVPIGERWDYTFHHWLGAQQAGKVGGGTADWYGIDQYLLYTINDRWKGGLRLEWFRDQDGTRVGLNRPSNPNKVPFVGNFTSLSAGLNWKPSANLTFRPEIRADWFDGAQAIKPFRDGKDSSQLMLGLDGIVLF
jgi:Putative beta-barrel porin-2, OmpL-like. bbp2